MTRIRGKTVYLLGAGFSRGSGAPTLSRFIDEGLILLKDASLKKKSDSQLLIELIKNVENTLGHYIAAAEFLPDRLVNLEDLFCLVDLRKQYDQESRDSTDDDQKHPASHETTLKKFVVAVLETAWEEHIRGWEKLKRPDGPRGTTLEDDPDKAKLPPVVPQRFQFKIGGKTTSSTDKFYNACAYQAFLSQILHDNDRKSPFNKDVADVIVTLNYDLLIERKLRSIATNPVYYGPLVKDRTTTIPNGEATTKIPRLITTWRNSKPRPLPLLKIHGSINWQTAVSADKISDASSAESVSRFWEPHFAGSNIDQDIRRMPIIPPTWRKTASADTVFARLLGEALKHMRLAEKIVIVGYSLPTTDAYFRYLLAEALGTPVLPVIELWDVIPTSKLEALMKRALGERIKRVAKVGSKKQRGFLELVCNRHVEESISDL